MSTEAFGRLGIVSALLATFFGGFFFVQASSVDVTLTIDGVETVAVESEVEAQYEVIITVTEDEVEEVLISIEHPDNFSLEGFANIDCGAGDDYSELFPGAPIEEIECFYGTAPFDGSETISFAITIDEDGEYILHVSSFLVGLDNYVDEAIALAVGDPIEEFIFESAEVYDLDGNGYIDTIRPVFSGGVPDRGSADPEDVMVDGYLVTDVGQWKVGSEVDFDFLMITLEEGTTPDSDATPEVTISNINTQDSVRVTENTVTPTDKASPVFLSAEIAEDGATIELIFSEDLNGTTVNNTGTDFSLSEGTITAADETANGVVTLTLAEVTDLETLDVTLVVGATNPNSVEDLAGNKAEEKTVSATRAEDSTPITIESVGLLTSGTSTEEVLDGDEITLTFSLSETASTTAVTILDESDVAVATTGTTYTAMYTVDADTPTGTVTFSISVFDEAGNESTADTTTDGSELTVVREGVEEEDEGGGGGGGEVDDLIDFSIVLESDNGGLNLISLPVSPEDTQIESVLGDISSSVVSVWTYIDGSWLVYRPGNPDFSTLTTMDAGYAYWIEVSEEVTLSGEGEIETDVRSLSTGWQMVGYLQPDISTDGSVSIDEAFFSVGLAGVAYSDLLLYNTDTGDFESALSVEPGDGLWMQVTEAGVSLSST